MPEREYFNGDYHYSVKSEEPTPEYARRRLTAEEYEAWRVGKFDFTQHWHYTPKYYLTPAAIERLNLDPELLWWVRAEQRPAYSVSNTPCDITEAAYKDFIARARPIVDGNARPMAEIEYKILGIEMTVEWYVGNDGVPATVEEPPMGGSDDPD